MRKQKPELYTHKKNGFSRLTGFVVKKFIVGKMEFFYQGEKPLEPAIFVGNHTKSYAPLAIQYTYPDNVRTWSVGAFTNVKECRQLFRNRILVNIKHEKLFRFLVPIVVPFLVLYYKRHLNSIPVWRDFNILRTFEKSIETLENGSHVAIYPETRDKKFNKYICAFETGFVYLAYNYYEATGKMVKIFPFYCAPAMHQTHFGNPIQFNPDMPIKEQAQQIAHYLERELTRVAESLPAHRIISMMGDIFCEGA